MVQVPPLYLRKLDLSFQIIGPERLGRVFQAISIRLKNQVRLAVLAQIRRAGKLSLKTQALHRRLRLDAIHDVPGEQVLEEVPHGHQAEAELREAASSEIDL